MMIKIDFERISLLLEALACELKSLNLWQIQPPRIDELSSNAPFCCDTLAFEQWLQFIFIPKITMMINQQQLPTKISLTPMAEEAFKHLSVNTKPLVDVIQKIDHTLTEQANKRGHDMNNSTVDIVLSADTDSEKPVLNILYQDEFMVAVDKPAGLFVHRSYMDRDEIYFALQLVRDQVGQYVYPVHRLDRPTSGVLLFALTKDVATKLNEAFANKSSQAELTSKLSSELEGESEYKLLQQDKDEEFSTNKSIDGCDLAMVKTYYALVRGHLAVPADLIDHALKEKLDKLGDKNVSRDKPAQSAQSYYQVKQQVSLPIQVGKFDSVRYSLVEVRPITGRRHQIRRHLAHLRHPILGDINYGDNKQNPFFIEHFGFKRLMLHAKSLEFNHPVSNERIKISAPFDEQWQQIFTTFEWPLI
ncbi:tRNA pseudouridine(65) synthase TruC [Colwellia sp. 12G3]|nr:YqcC family protein [Colwellia sp. 12G3]PKI17017.1 tRNA pseudouridine(65) synthase TruC [Colwellia sp. 12G3]